MGGEPARFIIVAVATCLLVTGCTTSSDDRTSATASASGSEEGTPPSRSAERQRSRVPNVAGWKSQQVGEHLEVVVAYERFLATSEASVRMSRRSGMVSNARAQALKQIVGMGNAVTHGGYKLVGQRSNNPLRIIPRPPRRALLIDCLTDGLHLVRQKDSDVPPPEHVVAKALLEFRGGDWTVIRFNRDETLPSKRPGPPKLIKECDRRFWSR